MTDHGTTVDSVRWRWRWLIFWHTLVAVVVGTWLWPTTGWIWQAADEAAAVGANGLLSFGRSHEVFWAFLNTRRFDLMAGLLMISLLAHYVWRSRDNAQLGRRIGEAAFIGLSLLLVLTVFREVVFDWVVDNRRDSPTLAMEPGTLLRLSELVPDLNAKDASEVCYPGDHGIVVGTFVSLFAFFAGRWYGLAASLMGVMFIMPRLVSGAHWMTDVVAGGFVIAAISAAWLLCTPFHIWGVATLEYCAHGIGNTTERLIKGRQKREAAARSRIR